MNVKRSKLDRLFSSYIKLRDKKCQACSKSHGLLDAAHIISRRYRSTRWAPENAVLLCRGCHMRYTQDPKAWVEWVSARMGKENYDLLYARAKVVARLWDRKITELHLKALLKDFDGGGD